MSKTKQEYDKIIEQRTVIVDKIKELKNNEIVKKYLELEKENDNLYYRQINLYGKLKREEYDNCNHVLVYSKVEYDSFEGRSYKYCGCIKCGLDNSVLAEERDWLPYERKIMYDYLRKKYLKGIKTDILCDINLATSIYSKIKESHPDIDDETAIKYFEVALNDIRNINVNDERKVNRAKRLSLTPKFTKWDDIDMFNI